MAPSVTLSETLSAAAVGRRGGRLRALAVVFRPFLDAVGFFAIDRYLVTVFHSAEFLKDWRGRKEGICRCDRLTRPRGRIAV